MRILSWNYSFGVYVPFLPWSPFFIITTQPHLHQYPKPTPTNINVRSKTNKTALLRPKPPLQHHHVGPLHTRPHGLPLHHQSLHHQHIGQLLRHGGPGHACFPGAGWWVVVVGGCYDGEWVYFGWDEGWGLIWFLPCYVLKYYIFVD